MISRKPRLSALPEQMRKRSSFAVQEKPLWSALNQSHSVFCHLMEHFENVLTPNIVWVDMNEMDFSSGAPGECYTLDTGQVYAGNAREHFIEAKPFEFQGL